MAFSCTVCSLTPFLAIAAAAGLGIATFNTLNGSCGAGSDTTAPVNSSLVSAGGSCELSGSCSPEGQVTLVAETTDSTVCQMASDCPMTEDCPMIEDCPTPDNCPAATQTSKVAFDHCEGGSADECRFSAEKTAATRDCGSCDKTGSNKIAADDASDADTTDG